MIIVFYKQAECQNRFSHLVEIEDKAESDWLASTFLNPGNGIVLHFYIYIYIQKAISKQIKFTLRGISIVSFLEQKMFMNLFRYFALTYIPGETVLF